MNQGVSIYQNLGVDIFREEIIILVSPVTTTKYAFQVFHVYQIFHKGFFL